MVQQAFLCAARKPERVPTDDPWPWFSVVVLHEARNLRRKKRPVSGVDLERSVRRPGANAPFDPIEEIARRETVERVRSALDTLPEPEREALVLTHITGWTHAQAAASLGVPRQTLTARVRRGLQRLQGKLGGESGAVACALGSLPVLLPARGWEAALLSWKARAFAALYGTVPSVVGGAAALVGGALLKKATMFLTAALGLGMGVGYLAGPALAPKDEFGSVPTRTTTGLAAQIAEDSALAGQEQNAATEELIETRARALAFEEQTIGLRERVALLEEQLAALAEAPAVCGPTFTFGACGSLPGVLQADWPKLAAAAGVLDAGLRERHRLREEGREVPRPLLVRIQEHSEILRQYEYRTLGAIPTAAPHNGELTHPISITNLIAAMLTEAALPLDERQIESINQLGLAFEQRFLALERHHERSEPLRAGQLLDEYLLKGSFGEDLLRVLRPEQRAVAVAEQHLRSRAGLDLLCPTLLLIHTSPLITGASSEEIQGKLVGLLSQRYELAEPQRAALEPAAERWLARCLPMLVEPIAPTLVSHYTFEEGALAGEATVDLLRELLAAVAQVDGKLGQRLLDEAGFFIPRLVGAPRPASS